LHRAHGLSVSKSLSKAIIVFTSSLRHCYGPVSELLTPFSRGLAALRKFAALLTNYSLSLGTHARNAQGRATPALRPPPARPQRNCTAYACRAGRRRAASRASVASSPGAPENHPVLAAAFWLTEPAAILLKSIYRGAVCNGKKSGRRERKRLVMPGAARAQPRATRRQARLGPEREEELPECTALALE